jgi:group II intron reverse transcriptase/maturase
MVEKTKSFSIPKKLFVEAFNRVKANAGAAGVDLESLADFERNLKGNLYRLWNRMSSGSYMPPAVKAVPIPKKSGGTRILGVPTVGDRIGQMVVKLIIEPRIETIFLPDSYGYRPKKSALDAIGVTRERCWRNDWVLEFDIKGLFDNISHELLMKAVRQHVSEPWILLYIERWLTAPLQQNDGSQVVRARGTPQGGVISPILSNLFLHYVFDAWMVRQHPDLLWCRYADDGLVHCKTLQQAEALLQQLQERFSACELELHPSKTKIVYCKDSNRKQDYPERSFTFLGYTFRARRAKNTKDNRVFANFSPGASKEAVKSMRAKTKKSNIRNRTELSLNDIAERFNPILQGWINYYGRYSPTVLYSVWRHFNKTLVSWAMAKYKPLRQRKTRAGLFLEKIVQKQPKLFAHWRAGMIGEFT